jgi:UDP-glucuronate decarboxylase
MQALRGEPITVAGDGSQTRSFCYISDLVEGLLRYMALDGEEPGPINLGNPDEITIAMLAETVLDLTGSRSVIERKPLPQDDPVRRRPAIDLARDKLQWEPGVALREGLVETIAYFDELLRKFGEGALRRVM